MFNTWHHGVASVPPDIVVDWPHEQGGSMLIVPVHSVHCASIVLEFIFRQQLKYYYLESLQQISSVKLMVRGGDSQSVR